MSYDIDLVESMCHECHCGDVVYHSNMTSNVSGMWDDAGIELRLYCYDREHAGDEARVVAPLLTEAIHKMEADPERYRAMEPSNGWGSYEGTLSFLRKLRDACLMYPNARIRGSN